MDYLQQANKDLEKKVKESSNGKNELRSQVKDLSEENEQLQVKIKKLEKKKNVAEEEREKVATIAVQDADEAKVMSNPVMPILMKVGYRNILDSRIKNYNLIVR